MKQPSGSVPVHRLSQGPEMQRNQGQKETEIEEIDIFGAIQMKPEGVLQFGFKNINGFPDPTRHPVKYDTLRAESREHDFRFDVQ